MRDRFRELGDRADYGSMPHGRLVRLAHAVGYFGDVRVADTLLREWRGTEHVDLLHEMWYSAALYSRDEVTEWVLAHRADIPSEESRLDAFIRFATRSGRASLLEDSFPRRRTMPHQ